MIKNKLIAARKEKKITQNNMAELLFINQSQYQRRECGEIHISNDEWNRMAKLLGKQVKDIKEEDNTNTVNNHDNLASNNYFYNIPGFIMKNQQEYIELLKEENKRLKEEIGHFKTIIKKNDYL